MGLAKVIKKRIVVSEHKNGVTMKELAKRYGITMTTVRNYIREDEEERKNKKAAEEKAKQQAAVKAARDVERRKPLKERSEITAQRKERVKADLEAGMLKEEIVEREGISRATINDYIRGDAMPAGAECYKDSLRIGVDRKTIREWSEGIIARQIKTPAGKATVCEVYPFFARVSKGGALQSFTLAELYYMNVR